MKKSLCILALGVLIYSAVVVGYNAKKPDTATSPVPEPTVQVPKPVLDITSLYNLTNVERTKANLVPLTLDPNLNASALEKCNDMVKNDYWDHYSPSGVDPWYFISKHSGYESAGENLANNFDSSEETVQAWMNSPSHKENIIKQVYTNVGFGICYSPNFTGRGQQVIIVQHFTQL